MENGKNKTLGWGFVDDYELIENGDMPLIKLKN